MSQNDFLQSWSQELLSRANRVRQLIGDAHWPSDGFHKEFLVREVLSRFIDAPLRVTSGFIRDSKGLVSPEIDVMIYSSALGPPYFREGDLAIVPPYAILALLEIKSKWSSQAAENVFEHSLKTWSVLSNRVDGTREYWTGAIFYYSAPTETEEKILKTAFRMIKKTYKKSGLSFLEFGRSLPKVISIIDRCILIIRLDNETSSVKLQLFESGDLSFAVQASDLFGHIHSILRSSSDPVHFEEELNLAYKFKLHERVEAI